MLFRIDHAAVETGHASAIATVFLTTVFWHVCEIIDRLGHVTRSRTVLCMSSSQAASFAHGHTLMGNGEPHSVIAVGATEMPRTLLGFKQRTRGMKIPKLSKDQYISTS